MNVKTLTEELAERLKLEERAQQDAVAGLPETMATSLTAAETGAVAAAEQAAKEEVRIVAQARMEAKAAQNQAKSELEQVRQARETIEDEAPPSPPNLDRLAMARDRATAAYAAFKSQHGLIRDATGDDRSAQVIWAVVVMVVESLFNAYFYMPISSLGLLGGLFTALFVSFANVGVAFVGGAVGLRFLAHVEPAKNSAAPSLRCWRSVAAPWWWRCRRCSAVMWTPWAMATSRARISRARLGTRQC